MINLYEAAKQYTKAGISVLPVKLSDKRPATPTFKQWMTAIPTEAEIDQLYPSLNGVHGIAVIGGAVSGNLEIIDFDNHTGSAKKTMTEWAKIPEVKEILDKYPFVLETSQSGGYHLIYRHLDTPHGAKKLAHEPKVENPEKDDDWWTLIETRGEGSYCVIYPSPGYVLKKGSFEQLPVITAEERDILVSNCCLFERKPAKEEKKLKLQSRNVTQLISNEQKQGSIFERFNSDPSSAQAVITLMEASGFKYSHNSRGNDYWTRPGKKTGVSVSFNGTVFYAFSSNALPFPYLQGVNVFTAYSLFAHNGDVKATIAEIRKDPRFADLNAKKIEKVRFEPHQVETGTSVVTPEGKVETTDFFVVLDTTKTPPRRSIRYDLFREFLNRAGFRKYREGDSLLYAKIQNNLVKMVQVEEMQSFVYRTILDQVDEETLSFVIGNVRLFSPQILAYLDPLPERFNESTKDKAWVYFADKAVAVTRDGFEPVDYKELEHPVWERHLLPWKWSDDILNQDGGEWMTFLQHVAGDKKTLERLMSGIGYLMTGYKQHSLAKAIILIDAKIPTISYDANGGTGKSLIGKWIAKYRSSCIIDGRKLNSKNNLQFLFQGVEPDTQIVFIDDADPHFDFQMLFSSITSDMTIRKMYQGEFVLPFERSPKFLSTTNHSIRGTDDSTNRRKYEIGISDFYGADRTPRDEFGHDLIYDWDDFQWKNSHFVMLKCLQYFLIHGLVADELNMPQILKKAISETSIDFVAFMFEQINVDRIRNNARFDRKSLFHDFMQDFIDVPDYNKLTLNNFTNWIEKFCRVFKLRHTKTRTNNINYSTIWGGIDEKIPTETRNKYLNEG